MGGRQLLNSSSHGRQEQLTSTIRTSTAKGGGIWAAAPSSEPTMDMQT